MQERVQKTSSQDNDCPRGARTESGNYYEGVQTYIWMTEDNVVEVPFDKEYLTVQQEQLRVPSEAWLS